MATKERKVKVQKKGEQLPQKKLEKPGDEIIGFFQGYKLVSFDDDRSETGKKAVRYYEFTEEEDEKKRFVVSGRLMLDQAVDDIAREQEEGLDSLKGELVCFRRLPDTKLTGKKKLGNYEVLVYETE